MKRFFLAALLLIAGKASLSAQTIEIPFTGDYADPTIVRVGEDFPE